MSNNSQCPVNPPKLLKANSTVETCASCGAWIERYPSFMGENDGFWECEKCGCTSTKSRDGKPFGRKSRRWSEIVELFEDSYTNMPYWDWNTIETDPPMKDLDWGSIENWYQSQNIYRMFIHIGTVEVKQS